MKKQSYNQAEAMMFREFEGHESELAREVRLSLELQQINELRVVQGLPLLEVHPETV